RGGRDRTAFVVAAIIEVGVEVADVADEASGSRRHGVRIRGRGAGAEVRDPAEGVAGNEVDGSRRRGAENGVERVVVEREVLRVVPQCRDRVAIVVAEHGRSVSGTALARRATGELRELIE